MEFLPLPKTTEQINSVVESFLALYHPEMSIPIPIEDIIDLKMKIDIIPLPGLKDFSEKAGLDEDAFVSSDFKSITVDDYISYNVENRFRFTLAHEIAHVMLHGYLYAGFTFNSIDQWKDCIKEMDIEKRRIVEWQADEFAGLILVPRKILKENFQKSLQDAEDRVGDKFKDNKNFIQDVAIEYYLAPKFCVSKEVARIRLERDKLIQKYRF